MTAQSEVFLWLKDVTKEDADIVGNKAAHLGELLQAGFPMLDGFIVTQASYFHFLQENRLTLKIKQLLTTVNFAHPHSLMQVSAHIKKLIMESPFPDDFVKEVNTMYQILCGSLGQIPVTLFVSGNNEQETGDFIFIKGEANLLMKIKEAWAASFSPHSLLLNHQKKRDQFTIGIAIVVQKTVFAEKAGVILTIDPLTNDTTKIIVEPHEHASITDDQLQELLMLGKKLQKHLYFPHEISWAIAKGKIYIEHLKHIPFTHVLPKEDSLPTKLQLILNGIPASAGMATGQVKIIHRTSDLSTIHHGDIIVAVETNPSFRQAIKKAGGVITEKGVRTSHAALLARELGKPAIVGVEKALSFLKNGMVITLKGTKGEIYKAHSLPKVFHTATRIFGDLSEKFSSENLTQADVDGIGFIASNIFLSNPLDELSALCAAFRPHPVLYQLPQFSDHTFKDEVHLIYRVRTEKKCDNLWIVLPALSNVKDLTKIKHFLATMGISRTPTFKLFLTVSIPATTIMLEDFIKAGIDGVVINIDELTNHLLPNVHDPLDPSVEWALERIIKTTNKHKLSSSIYGQALVEHPALIEKVVRLGITSITIQPVNLDQTRSHVATIEKRLIQHT